MPIKLDFEPNFNAEEAKNTLSWY